ncbi:hypothetical protein SAY87_023315 [Trapa incisa]|uniref:WD repeat-containing protein 75 second beta-propeller domain-containing protein n=1 Tax=Trapa incisa TaxID=236973 RepID=A0AAN7K7Z0_9MYRT|nr:hypothetical protein SAY87_023315 [Trapa incisa]
MIRGGRSYVSTSPAFSNDAKRLLVCTGSTVSIFSTLTGLQVASLDGHTALVTSVIVVPASSPGSRILCYCWTSSLDGTICYWDFSVPEMIKKIDVHLPIFSMVIPTLLKTPADSERSSDLYAYISAQNINKSERPKPLIGQLRKFNLTKSFIGGITLKETQRPEIITVCPSGRFFGILSKNKLIIWKVPDKESDQAILKKIVLHHTKKFSVLAFHPSQRLVAAGDVTGRILIWRGFGNRTFGKPMKYDEDNPGVRGDDDAESCSTWHWHPTDINVIAFSSDGAYLYSGGTEGVLVVWQLDTGKKKFLPRIGSPLLYFVDSPDPTLASISCADNRILLLKMPYLGIMKSISGIKLPFYAPEAFKVMCAGYAFDRAGVVALRTEDFHVQIYSLLDDREISEVVVCERNHQPADEITVVVTLVTLSQDGSVMSTVEVRLPEEDIGGLTCLKFWTSTSQNNQFELSTVIYEPHRDSHVSSVAFRPNRPMAVTTSEICDFKLWVCNDGTHRKNELKPSSGWVCYAVGSYKRRPLTAAAFSGDGSVLAVAADTAITLWDPDRNELVGVLGNTLGPIKALSFIGQSEYIVAASGGPKSQLSVWNMSQFTISWSYMLQVEAVASDQNSSTFAVLALLPKSVIQSKETTFVGRDGIILLFDVKQPQPVASWSVTKAEGGGLAFVEANQLEDDISPGTRKHGLLAFINGQHEYVLFDPFNDQELVEHSVLVRKSPAAEETVYAGYASLYGELPEFDWKKNQKAASEVVIMPSERPWETIFSGSSHTLPPLTKLCGAFLEALLQKRPAAVEKS